MIVTRSVLLFVFLFSFTSMLIADSHEDAINAAVNNPARSEQDRERDKSSKPAEVLAFFGVKPGMHVLDLFAGGGYYSELLAHVVGSDGKVVAHTNKAYKEFLKGALAERFSNEGIPPVQLLESEIPDLQLGKDNFDLVLLVLTYHDVYHVADYWPEVDREHFFRQIHDALKQGGTLAIIDHSALPGSGKAAAQDLHRIDEAFAIEDIESAGFTLAAKSDILRNVDDDRTIQVFDEKVRRKTDRFVHRYVKH